MATPAPSEDFVHELSPHDLPPGDTPEGAAPLAHGGWRRAVVGLGFGFGLGLLARLVLGRGRPG